jgi:hypothetical protein
VQPDFPCCQLFDSCVVEQWLIRASQRHDRTGAEWELIFGDRSFQNVKSVSAVPAMRRDAGAVGDRRADTETSAAFGGTSVWIEGPEGLDAASGGIGAAAALASGAPLTSLFAGGSSLWVPSFRKAIPLLSAPQVECLHTRIEGGDKKGPWASRTI